MSDPGYLSTRVAGVIWRVASSAADTPSDTPVECGEVYGGERLDGVV